MPIGKLKLKQKFDKPKLKPTKEQKEAIEEIFNQKGKLPQTKTIFQPFLGEGTIAMSVRSVHGLQTKFNSEIQKGDSILVQNPLLKTMEQRVVTLVLGDDSIMLEEPFLEDYHKHCKYYIRKKPKDEVEEDIAEEYKERLAELTKSKGIKKQTAEVRRKKGLWSYQHAKIQVDGNSSRQQLLNARQKMVKDKFCW